MQALRFAGPFGFLLSIPVLFGVFPGAPLLTPLAILVALLVTEQMGRTDRPHCAPSAAFRLLPVLYIPLQLGVIMWAAMTMNSSSGLALLALAVSVGACTGVFGMLAAHEMVHSGSQPQRFLGLVMLFGMSYPHFRLAHVHGHHRHAATAGDASTARLGEGFYRFLLRTIPGQILIAWTFERRRTRTKRIRLLHNRVLQGGLILIVAFAALSMCYPRAAAFFAAESAVAILVLELFNYVAHYGLVRRRRGASFEPFADRHSWNSSGIGNLLIFNMGRHSDHHRRPALSYERLERAARGPELPYGYAGAILLALAPPLWRAVMDRRIAAVASPPPESGYSGESPTTAML